MAETDPLPDPGPLTDAEKVDARRFCGFPAYGPGPGDGSFQRYYPAYEALEYRLGNLQPAELAVCRGKLADLAVLDAAVVSAGLRLDTDSAAAWRRNAGEPWDRQKLYDLRRRDLCAFLGVPPGPALAATASMGGGAGGGMGGGTIRMIV